MYVPALNGLTFHYLYRLKCRTLNNWYLLVGNWGLVPTMEYAMLYQLHRSVLILVIFDNNDVTEVLLNDYITQISGLPEVWYSSS